MPKSKPPSWFDARAIIAADLYRDGQITRTECFRIEVDKVLLRDSGPIRYEINTEHRDHMRFNREYLEREYERLGLDLRETELRGARFIEEMKQRYLSR